MDNTSSDPNDPAGDGAAGTTPHDTSAPTPDPADTEHPAGEEQAKRNIEQEPPG